MPNIVISGSDFNADTPATGDVIVVPNTNANDITAGLDQNDDYYDMLTFSRGYLGKVAAGSYLECNSAVLKLLSGGAINIKSNGGNPGSGSELMDDTLIEMMAPNVTVNLASETTQHADSVWQRIYANRGTITIEASVEFGSGALLNLGYVDNRSGDVTMTLAAETGSGNAVPNLYADGGKIYSNRTVTAAVIGNCEVWQDTNPITTLTIEAGGVVHYQHTAGTTIIVKPGGTLDLSLKQQVKTITRIIVCRGGVLDGYDRQFHSGTLEDWRMTA
jgi:hypothetical protein